MSRSAQVAMSESIDRVCGRGWPDIGLEAVAADDIDGAVEKFRDVILERNVFKDADPGSRIDLNHNIDVAVRPVVATRSRAKQGCVTDAPRAQRGLVRPQLGDDFLTVHFAEIRSDQRLCQMLC